MKAPVRILLWSGAGWLGGEIMARTLFVRETASVRPAVVPAVRAGGEHSKSQGDDWQEFLRQQNVAAPSRITIAEAFTLASEGRDSLADPDARLVFARRLALASPEEFPALLESLAAIRDVRVRMQVAGAFFAAWAAHDPLEAMAASGKVPGLAMTALIGVLRVWADNDPRGMMAWVKSPDTLGWAKMQAESSAIGLLAARDPLLAMELSAEDSSDDRRSDRNTIFRVWHERDPDAAEQWLNAAPEAERHELFEVMVVRRAELDPAAAWELAQAQHPGNEQWAQVLPYVHNLWAKKDAAAARTALENLPREAWQPSLATITGNWLGAEDNLRDLDAYAARMPESSRTSFWAGVAESAIDNHKDPARAARAFAHLPEDHGDRVELAENITEAWMDADKVEEASTWVSSLPPGRARDSGAAILAEELMATDPDAAKAWAGDIGDPGIRKRVLER